jgi:lysophospholipase L1-like esterase
VRWPDLLATDLRSVHPGLEYFNLARDGADSAAVVAQVPQAASLQPDLVTLVCGANDVILALRPDLEAFRGRLGLIIDRLRKGSPDLTVVTATYPEQWTLEGSGPRTRDKIATGMKRLNEVTRQVSAERSVVCLDVVDHPAIADPANYEADGLHPSVEGHRYAAAEFSQTVNRQFSKPDQDQRRKWRLRR